MPPVYDKSNLFTDARYLVSVKVLESIMKLTTRFNPNQFDQ